MSTTTGDDAPHIGPYRGLRELGRGGQAIVWLAEDTRIGRQVALKVLPNLGPGGEEALRRFRREAEVAARLEHTSICNVLEAELDHGTPYIAMRYVPGETLARRFAAAREAGERPPARTALRELASFFEKAARALHVAHEAGIVHRDVKPANIMVTPEGEPVILDFGLAREDDGTAQALSLTGEASGTPAYMSPEQMTGRSRPDRRTDVWSLGIAIYEAATLAHPFASATREKLFQSILSEEPPDPRRVNPEIDRDLATILETATAKERDRRYQTALDLAEDLRRWRANEPIRARAVGRVERLGRWAQRKPALAASIGAVAVLALAASAFLFYGIGAADRAALQAQLRAVAEEAQALAELERERAEAAQGQAETERERAEEARAQAELERGRAEAARSELEQVDADRALSDELDELNMQMGALVFGMDAKEAVPALAPKYLAAFRRFGIDFADETGHARSIARFEALRSRDFELWRAVQDALDGLGSILALDDDSASIRNRLTATLAAFPEEPWPELDRAEKRWDEEGVDEFGPLLAEDVLATRSANQLYELAGELLVMPERRGDAQRVLERSLETDPGSFRLHFLIAALGFMQVMDAYASDPQSASTHGAKLLHHMRVAVALRLRSGFVRAMLASALGMTGSYEEAIRCMDDATELEPDNALVWLYRARFYSYAPMPEPGIEACKRALELDPTLGGARKLLAEFEARSKQD